MKRIVLPGFVLYVAFALTVAAARDNSLSINADSLGGMVLGRSIRLMTTDGTYLEGKAIRTTREEITLKVKRVEPKTRFQGREVTIPASEISVVRMSKSGPMAVPIALGVLGGFGGGVAAAYAAQYMDSEGGAVAACLAGIVGGSTGGAILGREAAKGTVTINVIQPAKKPGRLAEGLDLLSR